MYIDSIFTNNTMNCLACSNILLTCEDDADEMNKTVNFPSWFDINNSISFKVRFKNGCYTTTTAPLNNITLNGKKIYVNKNGIFSELQYHYINTYTTIGNNREKWITLQNNTILELYYDSTLDSNGGFVIVGNPLLISMQYENYDGNYQQSNTYNYFADNTNKGMTYSIILDNTDKHVNSTNVVYNLNDGENFLDWDFIMTCISMYTNGGDGSDDIQVVNRIIPKQKIMESISNNSTSFFSVNSTGSQDRRLVWNCVSSNQFNISNIRGPSGHLPRFKYMYGINLN